MHKLLRAGRWLVALPAGALAAFAAHMALGFMFSLGHGFETVGRFWASPDMAGMPISGTYIMFVSRLATGVAFLYVTIALIPNYKKQAAVVLVVVLSLVVVGGLIYLAWATSASGDALTVGIWYRNILETVSSCLGMALGAGIAVAHGSFKHE